MKPYAISEESECDTSDMLYFISRESCLSRVEPYITWIVDKGCERYIELPVRKGYDSYVHKESFLHVLKKLAEEMERDWDTHLEHYDHRKEKLLRDAEYAGRDPTVITYKRFTQSAYDFCEYIWGAWAVIYHIEPLLLNEAPDDIDWIAALGRPTEYHNMLLSDDPAGRLAEKYGWLNVYSVRDEPYGEEDFERMEEKITEDFEGNEHKFNENLESLPEALQKKARMIHTYAWLKTDRIDVWKQAMFLVKPLYDRICSRLGMSLRAASNLSVKETIETLKGRTVELHGREDDSMAYCIRKGAIALVEDIDKLQDELEERTGGEVNGIPACRGQAEGPARIVRSVADLEKVREGDILIAKFTAPTFTPAMKKAAAIVTDDGGITSHAGIVAREYGIPCVVGTGNATRAFRNGQHVEVDAEKGLVRKREI